MDSSKISAEFDMNDPSNLAFYSQILLFKNDLSRKELVFNNPETTQQRALQAFAHMCELEYEYALATRDVRIIRAADLKTDDRKDTTSILSNELASQELETNSRHPVPATPQLLDFPDLDFGSGELDFWPDLTALELDALQEQSEPVAGRSPRTPKARGTSIDLENDDLSLSGHTSGLLNGSSAHQELFLNEDWPFIDLAADESSFKPWSTTLDSSVFSNFSSQAIFSEGNYEETSSVPTESTSISSYRGNNTSKANSISSIESRGRKSAMKLFRGSSRMSHRSGTGFEEVVFDSRSSRAASRASSGRHGPLNRTARATMKAVKAVGACWRCKFLRKPCSADTPCEACPKGSFTSNWGAVGCKRGDIRDEMPATALCPQFNSGKASHAAKPLLPHQGKEYWEVANFCLRKSIEKRDGDIADLKASTSANSGKETDFAILVRGLEYGRPSVVDAPLGSPTSPALKPLDDSILAIVWEALASHWTPVIPDECSLDHLQRLLRAAAVYQTRVGSNFLIAQSLHCLRLCLEAMHCVTFGSTNSLSHTSCRANLCNVDCIQMLEVSCQGYLAELSSVFFKKENLRDKAWWLSAFYSFCIQAHVRKALMLLEYDLELEPPQKGRYLHIAIRLFIASSGKYDPLIQDWSSNSEAISAEERACASDYERAQSSVQQADWVANGIAGSGDYLKQLFEDNGTALGTR